MSKVEEKLKQLPTTPGVYFHKNKAGEIIYIGKAANLRNRVRQYFQKSRYRDPKTDALVNEIADLDWTEVETEIDALFLEAELVRRYLPPYNIMLRDDKSLVYVRVSYKDPHPTVTLTRRPLDDAAEYFGPYINAFSIKQALKLLRRIFPYSVHLTPPKRACLEFHLGLCPGLEESKTNLEDYRANLRRLIRFFKGERTKLISELEQTMKRHAKKLEFEHAASAKKQLHLLQSLKRQILFGDRELQDISKDLGLAELKKVLGLKNDLKLLECYDISHMQGSDNVASMVVFHAGIPDKRRYRKFKMRLLGNDDFAHMNEVITRRLAPKHIKEWGQANLMVIDGGKGQLSAARAAQAKLGHDFPMIGLAKKYETIIVDNSDKKIDVNQKYIAQVGGIAKNGEQFAEIELPMSSHAIKLLQRLRDESHRFAVSYHSVLKTKRQTASLLDDIPGIGDSTRKKLLRAFGSFKQIGLASEAEVATVVGSAKAKVLKQHIKTD